ncbi:MAG: lipid II flippase MurJ, partial [Patescibacteria group bacterium]
SFWAALRHIVFWTVPATVLFIVLRAHIVRVILGAGAFGWVDTRMTAAALLLFSLSILAQGLVMLLIRAFYAAGRTVFPVLINLISSVFIVVGSFAAVGFFGKSSEFREIFTSLLRVADVPGSAMLVLPAMFSLGSILNVVLLGWGFRRMLQRPRIQAASGFCKSLAEICFASLMLGIVSYLSLQWLNGVFGLTTFVGVFLEGLFAGALGMLTAAIALWAMANEEFLVIVRTLHQKFWKTGVISQEPEKII